MVGGADLDLVVRIEVDPLRSDVFLGEAFRVDVFESEADLGEVVYEFFFCKDVFSFEDVVTHMTHLHMLIRYDELFRPFNV